MVVPLRSVLAVAHVDRDGDLGSLRAVGEGGNVTSLLWLVFAVLLVLWLVGYAVNWGAFIWVLLLFALVALVANLITGTRRGRWY